jgi:hypothetical protein
MRGERNALIDEILDARGPSGSAVGIFGVKTCQACGRPGSFAGWAGAMAGHPGGVFIALGHHHDESAVRTALSEGAPRFCVICARLAVRSYGPRRARERDPLCERCVIAGVDAGRIARFRFLDERHATIGALRAARERFEHTLALEGTAPGREIAAAKLALRRTLRRLRRTRIARPRS